MLKVISLITCEACGALIDEDGKDRDPLASPEELLAQVLGKVPQYSESAIPKPFLDACLEVLQDELKKRDRAIRQLKSMFTEEELLVGGRKQ